ncbi:MAG: DinB family protein [Opitutales bacterium]
MASLLHDNANCLEQIRRLLTDLPGEAYRCAHPAVFDASIGQHLRHVVDHYEQFLGGLDEGVIDYSRRSRRQAVETDRSTAVGLLEDQQAALRRLAEAGLDLDEPVEVHEEADGADAAPAASTLRRELQFLLSHTVHHCALIGVICRQTEQALPEGFGIAPSTLRYRAARRQPTEGRS